MWIARSVAVSLLLIATEIVSANPEVRRDRYGDPLPERAIARLGAVRFRHGGRLHDVAFTDKGKTITSFGSDNVFRVWQVRTGKQIRSIPYRGESPYWITRGDFSPSGRYFSAADGDFVFACDVRSGKELLRVHVHGKTSFREVTAIDSKGKYFAVGNGSGEVVVWNIAKGTQAWKFSWGKEPINALEFSPDGTMLAIGTVRDRIGLWHAKTNKTIELSQALPFFDQKPTVLSFSADGQRLVTGALVARLWDTQTGELVQKFDDRSKQGKGKTSGRLGAARISPDGKRLILSARDHTWMERWDVETGTLLVRKKLVTGFDDPHRPRCTLSPNGDLFAFWMGYNAFRCWNLRTNTELHPVEAHIDGLSLGDIAPDGTTVAINSKLLGVWNADSGKPLRPLTWRPGLKGLAFDPSGTKLVCVDSKGKLDIEAVATAKALDSRRAEGVDPSRFSEVTVSADRRMWALLFRDNLVLHDFTTGKFRRSPFPFRHMCHNIALMSDERRLVVGFFPDLLDDPEGDAKWGPQRSLRVWDIAKRNEVPFLSEPAEFGVSGFSFSHDERMLATVCYEDRLRLFEIASGRSCYRGNGYTCARYSRDGRWLACGTPTGEVHVFDPPTMQTLVVLKGHHGRINALAFSERSDRLVSFSRDTTALVWDLRDLPQRRLADKPLTTAELERHWKALTERVGPDAFRAMRELVRSPKQTVAFLRDKLSPVTIDDAQVRRWLRDLDDGDFDVRERATQALVRLGGAIAPIIREVRAEPLSNEVENRLRYIQKQIDNPVPSPSVLQTLRAIAVLERVGTADTVRILQMLAKGHRASRITRQARASWERLVSRSLEGVVDPPTRP